MPDEKSASITQSTQNSMAKPKRVLTTKICAIYNCPEVIPARAKYCVEHKVDYMMAYSRRQTFRPRLKPE
jgi:hypothetical protein